MKHVRAGVQGLWRDNMSEATGSRLFTSEVQSTAGLPVGSLFSRKVVRCIYHVSMAVRVQACDPSTEEAKYQVPGQQNCSKTLSSINQSVRCQT